MVHDRRVNGRGLQYFAAGMAILAAGLGPQAVGQINNTRPQVQGAEGKDREFQPRVTILQPLSQTNQTLSEIEQNPRRQQPLTVEDHLRRFAWRFVRDPIADLTMFLFAIGYFQFRLLRKTAQRQLRAYVSVNIKTLRLSVSGEGAEAEIELKNGGQTPAYKCCHAGNIVILSDDAAEREFTRTDRRAELGRASPFTLQIDGTATGSVPAHKFLGNDDLVAFSAGDRSLYVFGVVFYEDTFGKKRHTRFCYRTTGVAPPKILPPGRQAVVAHQWDMAPFHNDSD